MYINVWYSTKDCLSYSDCPPVQICPSYSKAHVHDKTTSLCLCIEIDHPNQACYSFCPILFNSSLLFHTLPQIFFSLLDNFSSIRIQSSLHVQPSNRMYFNHFIFHFICKSFPKRKTFLFQPHKKFPVLENFFRMQRYKIITTSQQKKQTFFQKTQKKMFFHSPTPPFAH